MRSVLSRLGIRLPDLLSQLLRESDPRHALSAPAYMINGGSLYRIVTDHLGTPRLSVNVTTGTVGERLDLDEWGKIGGDTTPGFSPFGFAAGLRDVDTGLTRFGARDYDAPLGRWTTADPSHPNVRRLNGYVYGNDDPVNTLDRRGLDCTDATLGAAATCSSAEPACAGGPLTAPGCVAMLAACAFASAAAAYSCRPPDPPQPPPPPPPTPPGPGNGAEGTGSSGGGCSGGGGGNPGY